LTVRPRRWAPWPHSCHIDSWFSVWKCSSDVSYLFNVLKIAVAV
jgi:hypothetical protein